MMPKMSMFSLSTHHLLGESELILHSIKEFFFQVLLPHLPSSTIPSASLALCCLCKVLLLLFLFPCLCSCHFLLHGSMNRDFRTKYLQYKQTFLLLKLTTTSHNLMDYHNLKIFIFFMEVKLLSVIF